MKISKSQTKKRILDLLGQMDWLFGLNNFERELIFKKVDEDDKGAEIAFEENYQRVTINIYPAYFEEKVEYQRKILLHEFCHCITIPSKCLGYDLLDGELVTRGQIKQENERMTSKFENILDGLLQGKLRYASKAYKDYVK